MKIITMFKKWISYLLPVNIYNKKSAVSKSLEVTWNNGELVLDSPNTNYSYGSLQRVLRKGLKYIGFSKIQTMQHILVLGVGGGSVIKTIVDEIHYKNKITGVEIDADVIEIANQYFQLDEIKNLSIVIDDAFEFVLKSKDKYDLIIIDVFQDINMPNFLFEEFFCNRISFLLNHRGYIIFNTMCLTNEDNKRNKNYIQLYNLNNFSVSSLPRIESHNELFIIQKLH